MNINITILSVLMQFASVDGHVRDAQTHKPLALVRIELSHLGVANATEYTQLELYLKEAPDGPESERVRQALRSAKSK